MTNWRFHYEVGQLVRDGNPEDFKEIATKIFNALTEHKGFRNEAGRQLLKNLTTVESVEEFDDAWNEIYNYADRERIWLWCLNIELSNQNRTT